MSRDHDLAIIMGVGGDAVALSATPPLEPSATPYRQLPVHPLALCSCMQSLVGLAHCRVPGTWNEALGNLNSYIHQHSQQPEHRKWPFLSKMVK